MKHISLLVHTLSSRRNDLKDADRNKIQWINLSFLGQYRIREFCGNTFWKMEVFLSENKGHFHVLKAHRTFKHIIICAESQTPHMRSRFSALTPRFQPYWLSLFAILKQPFGSSTRRRFVSFGSIAFITKEQHHSEFSELFS